MDSIGTVAECASQARQYRGSRLESTGMADWDADAYHRLSEPQLAWGRDVLARIELRGDEIAADVGCGTGRLTAELAERLPRGRVAAIDQSETMVALAKEFLAQTRLTASAKAPAVRRSFERRRKARTTETSLKARTTPVGVVRADAAALPFDRALDLIFSTATFHWVQDHDRLFASLFAALRPGGRLVAQCGGGPNLGRLLEHANALMHHDEFAAYFRDWRAPWNFADADSTRRRLEAAGFVNVATTLYPSPVSFDAAEVYRDFLKTVCVRHHVARLPLELQPAFTARLVEAAAGDDPPFTLDYFRLDMTASVPFLH
jgi:trans-aconitate 2-methyltransferase